MPNRRQRTRIPFRTTANVHATGAMLVDQEVRDLSLTGVFVLGNHPLKAGQSCMVTIHLYEGDESDNVNVTDLTMEGKVLRVHEDGTAIQFEFLDPDSYLHLRRVVLLNVDDPDQVAQEFNTAVFDSQSEDF